MKFIGRQDLRSIQHDWLSEYAETFPVVMAKALTSFYSSCELEGWAVDRKPPPDVMQEDVMSAVFEQNLLHFFPRSYSKML